MKLSVTDLIILVDTLTGSLAIRDGGTLFHYTRETRKAVLDSLLNRANKQTVELEPDPSEIQSDPYEANNLMPEEQ
jgi:hypothetical protein